MLEEKWYLNSVNDFSFKNKIKGKIGNFSFKDKKVFKNLKFIKQKIINLSNINFFF